MTGLLGKHVLLLATALTGATAAAAAPPVEDVVSPPVLRASNAPPTTKLLTATPGLPGAKGTRVLDLKIQYVDYRLFNPAENRSDAVHLRGYTGTGMDPKAPYVSPTIEIRPGETVRINLDNTLDPVTDPRFDAGCAPADHRPNTPHCFNGTNLHTHGLWVNPSGNGDNVLLSINPKVKFTYEYNIPDDHPSGTFWYHTHRHGSTALQVSSGMAGALIIRGDRLPTPTANGDLDTLLKGMTERVLVFQQIQYACLDADGKAKVYKNDPGHRDGTYRCDPATAGHSADIGVIENYKVFGPGSWPKSGRYTSINGLVIPTFQAQQGRIERWRMIHGGVRDTISLRFVKAADNLTQVPAPRGSKEMIASLCTGATLPYNLVAADGLTLGAAQQVPVAVFQPGYRFDALMAFREPGLYCVLDQESPAEGTVDGERVPTALLGLVYVAPGTSVGPDPRAYVQKALVAAAGLAMPPAVRQAVVADLQSGLRFTRFVPHPTIQANEVTGTQELTFFIDVNNGPVKFEVGNTLATKDVQPYDPNRVDRQLTLGGVDEWTLQSHFVSHPFHIHVNPFQVVSIRDPNNKEVSSPGAVDDYGVSANPGSLPDPQYPGLQGVWKDTLWIKSLVGENGTNVPPGTSGIYTIKVRTRYQRYIGEYVLHCHILDHEDQGMMQNVAVVLPQGDFAANARGEKAGAGTASGPNLHDHH
jgi:FtsP/CotA-like multicopper oxidase with cupredoxin domain